MVENKESGKKIKISGKGKLEWEWNIKWIKVKSNKLNTNRCYIRIESTIYE